MAISRTLIVRRYADKAGLALRENPDFASARHLVRHSRQARFGTDITIHGPTDPGQRGGVLSFAFRDLHPHDVSQVLDQRNVCIRAGHHCAKPLMRILGAAATARASFYVYNDRDDVDALADALAGASDIFGL